MDFLLQLQQLLVAGIQDMTDAFGAYLPSLAKGLGIIITGFLIAMFCKWLIIRLCAGLDRVAHVIGVTTIPILRNWPIGVILGWLAFWILMLLFLTAAAGILGLPGLAAWLQRLIDNLPLYFMAGTGVLAGIWVGHYVNIRIRARAAAGAERQAEALGTTLKFFIISFAVISALSQTGLDMSLFETMLVIFVAAMLVAAALAFGLGAGPSLANIISGRYLRKTFRVGQRISIDRYEGEILELLPTGMVLDTDDGRTFIPAKLFADQVSVLLDNDDGHER